MKYLIIALCIAIVSPCGILAAGSAYVGLYSDYSRSTWCVDGEPVYEIDVWVWVLTPQEGMEAFGYNLTIPEACTLVDTDYNPSVIPEIVEPPEPGKDPEPHFDYSAALEMCKPYAWIWTYHFVFSVSEGTQGIFEITSHPELGESVLRDCSDVSHELVKLTNIYVNYPPASAECWTVSTEAVSWSAIKGLFDR
jgi:hypothetical protein